MLTIGQLRTYIVKSATVSLLLQIVFAGLSFINAILLARLIGIDGYGAFANAMGWVTLLVIPATFGFGALLVREVAIYRARTNWSALLGILKYTDRFVLFTSIITSIGIIFLAIYIFSSPAQEKARVALLIASPLVPILALSSLRDSTLRGFEKIFHAQAPSLIFRSTIILTGLLLIYYLFPEYLKVSTAMAINVLGAVVVFLTLERWQKKAIPSECRKVLPEYHRKIWLNSAYPLLLYGGMQIVLGQTDIVMLGLIRDVEDVGLYAGSSRIALILGYVTMAIEMIQGPVIAKLYKTDEHKKLQKVLTDTVRIAFYVTLPVGILIVIFGENILQVFGSSFTEAYPVLVVLSLSRLVHVALGPGALVLSMTGSEKKVSKIVSLAALLNIVGNGLLIPRFGMEGAAISTAISLIIMRGVLSKSAASVSGLHVTIFGMSNR